MTPRRTILVVDDQASARLFLGRYLAEVGYEVHEADSVQQALRRVEEHHIDVVITDLRMPGMDGLQGVKLLRSEHANLPVIVLTAYPTVETAVQAMRLGAFEYLRKPFEPEELELIVARAIEHRSLVEENQKLRAEVDGRFRLDNLVGRSPAMLKVFDLVRRVAPVDVPVLITGESGTGKDLVARAVHGLSSRTTQKFLSINCAAIHDTLLESELFGHERGAFSGAEKARPGYFREADHGTLFLDEIGDMSMKQQARLLRVLESGELIPVGAENAVQVDVRVVTATNHDLEALVRQQEFREDLLYRIDAMRIHLPPLRERREDIPLLLATFLERVRLQGRGIPPRVGADAMNMLLEYGWPGNVRELAHCVEHAALVVEGEQILPEHLPQRVREWRRGDEERSDVYDLPWKQAKDAFEADYLGEILRRAEGNITRAARLAGVHRATLHDKVRRYGLGPHGQEGAPGTIKGGTIIP